MPRQVFQRSVTGLSDGARNVSMGSDSSKPWNTGLYIHVQSLGPLSRVGNTLPVPSTRLLVHGRLIARQPTLRSGQIVRAFFYSLYQSLAAGPTHVKQCHYQRSKRSF